MWRELSHILERGMLLAREGVITASDLPPEVARAWASEGAMEWVAWQTIGPRWRCWNGDTSIGVLFAYGRKIRRELP